MSELLPTLQARNVRAGLLDFLVTTFALTDADARDALDDFLSDPESGMFKGPYGRLRLPFRPAEIGWRDSLEWYEGFTPYGHQAEAFTRLTSIENGHSRRPLPTLVTTGTGSGKTESFLYPILDHVLRARRNGVSGTKALLLYPMNALANDQAQRLARMITTHPELAHITAALYVGQDGPKRTIVSADGLITERSIIRDKAPDILLTNYKMLDQLLLRSDDQQIWKQSASSLQYLVLDEFHTYDGAQGTDVAMLLRRLGLTLKSYWGADDPQYSERDRSLPLGRITPVATSATLGDKGDPTVMVDFAHTVFGEDFDSSSVITEDRLSVTEWSTGAAERVNELGLSPIAITDINVERALASLASLGDQPTAHAVALAVLSELYAFTDESVDTNVGEFIAPLLEQSPELWPVLVKAHPLVLLLADIAAEATAIADLAVELLTHTGQSPRATPMLTTQWSNFLLSVFGLLGHVRALSGRSALSIDVHMWVRELSRIDRDAAATTHFRWADDGPVLPSEDAEEVRPSFPAIYCRHCGRSGWGIGLAPVGLDLSSDDDSIRRNHAVREGRFRALIYAPTEAFVSQDSGEDVDGLAWFSIRERALLTTAPDELEKDVQDGWVLPILMLDGADADVDSANDVCPSCAQQDGIQFLGSRIATLLSVSLSTMFGDAELDAVEKKALVFTDSVQDAAHRAGFIQARSHTLTLRSVLRQAVGDGALPLDVLVEEVIAQAGDDPFARYRLIAPDCADRESFMPFWQAPSLREVPATVRGRVKRRLMFDAVMEFGLNSRLGRTLELTGSVAAEVSAPAERLTRAGQTVLEGFPLQLDTDSGAAARDNAVVLRWARGVIEHMRTQGAIDHPWFEKYRQEDGSRYSIWGGRPRDAGMPAFPSSRPAPAYPRVGGSTVAKNKSGLDPVTPARSWYARWTGRVLGVSPSDGARLAKGLLERLAHDGVLESMQSASGAQVFAIPLTSLVIEPVNEGSLNNARNMLACDVCRALTPGSPTVVAQLTGAPCFSVRCSGSLSPEIQVDGFYRRLYSSSDMHRIVAREHTSLLDDKTRLEHENGFKNSSGDPQSPNVLVATPTLELGIDIGDLSAVYLSSLPKTVAAYLQRVGRAGRLTGNALSLAYVSGRGQHLPTLGDPLSMINGEVRPPATYLQAEEILQRQFTAHLMDVMARDSGRAHPRRATAVFGSSDSGTFLGDLIELCDSDPAGHVERFALTLQESSEAATACLLPWVEGPLGPGTSRFAAHLYSASTLWRTNVEVLGHRLVAIDALLPELERVAASPAATDDDKRAERSAKTTRKLTAGQLAELRSDFWIGVLEEYGILPNYTLVEDSVSLDVGLSWMDPESGTFQNEHAQFSRGSAQAIREFAPGATFYARGWEVKVDAVDLGMDGEAIRPWAFCPQCGFATDLALEGAVQTVSACPRCGSSEISDTGQRMDVIEFRRATAEVRRDEVAISDRRDQRDNIPFQMFVSADIDPSDIGSRWFVEETNLGCTYLRSINIRWVNAGTPGRGGRKEIAGVERTASLFRVCSGCGKLDVEAGHNSRYEHRPWCVHRDSIDEVTRDIALMRTLRTQGLLIRLPFAVTVGDDYAIPSLSAALLLGLREQLGGHPDHISVEEVVDPTLSDGSKNHKALLLHDTVPGGTGYLADFAHPERLRELLEIAWVKVRDCECRFEQRQSCHRCLLPFAAGVPVRLISRTAAERHLRTLLGLSPNALDTSEISWTLLEQAPDDSNVESHLEQRFRRVIVDRLQSMGAFITEVPGAWGNTVRFSLPGQPRQWTLSPQVPMHGCRPDFVLQSNDINVPAVAVFTDGHRFHAVPDKNRLADDAQKRADLRAHNIVVIGVSARDVSQDPALSPVLPDWINSQLLGEFMMQKEFIASPSAYNSVGRGPIDFIVDWINAPDVSDLTQVARAVPMLLSRQVAYAQDWTQAPANASLASLAVARIFGERVTENDSPRRVITWKRGSLSVAMESREKTGVIEIALVLDDRNESLDAAHADSWREWLLLSNSLALRDWPTVVSTLSLALREEASGVAQEPGHDLEPADPEAGLLAPEWAQALSDASPGVERALVQALAATARFPAPTIGLEGPDGIALDLVWPEFQVAVRLPGLSHADEVELTALGWQILDPSPVAIIEAFEKLLSESSTLLLERNI